MSTTPAGPPPDVDNRNHQQLIETHNPWIHYYVCEPARSENQLLGNPNRERTNTIYHWQNVDVSEKCAVLISEHGTNASWIPKSRDNSADVTFSIQGGSHFPRFSLRLHLQHPKKPVSMTVLFPAFGPTERENPKFGGFVQLGRPLATISSTNNPEFTFSHHLGKVKFDKVVIKEKFKDTANPTGVTDDKLHWVIHWKTLLTPPCINTDADVSHLTTAQQNVARLFRSMNRVENDIRVVIWTHSNKLASKIAHFINMPQVTPPPLPLYHPIFDRNTLKMLALYVANIEPLYTRGANDQVILNMAGHHYAIRNKGWQKKSMMEANSVLSWSANREPRFVSLPMKGKGAQNPQDSGSRGFGYYINEREYEAVQIVGLARELQYADRFTTQLFNGIYDFDLVPAGLTSRETGASTNEFYIFINVRPTRYHGDQAVIPPSPGVRVTITIRENMVKTGLQNARMQPKIALDTSGTQKSLTPFSWNQLKVSGSRDVQSPGMLVRDSSSGASPRSTHSRQGSQIGSPSHQLGYMSMTDPEPSHTLFPSSANDRVWHGVVVPRSGANHDEFDIAIYVSIESTGLGMGLQDCQGYFNFGDVSAPFKQAEQAVHLAMHGEGSFYHIPESNFVKIILLAHRNQTIGTEAWGIPVPTPTLLSGITLNKKQREAFDHAVSTSLPPPNLNSRLALIAAPAGTGKTLIATSIAFHSYGRHERLLMTAGSNYAVDTMADSIFKACHSLRPVSLSWTDKNDNNHKAIITHQAKNGIWGIYRLEKEADEHYSNFVQNEELLDPKTLMSGRDELDASINGAPHPYNTQVDFDTVTEGEYRSIENYVKYRATTGRRLSLGDHILARIQKAQSEKSQWVNDWQYAEEEHVKLWWFISLRVWLSKLGYQYADLVGTTAAEEAENGRHMNEDATRLSRASVAAWRDLQAFYLTHARIVLVTASTAGRKTLRRFRAVRVLCDEAAQVTEIEVLNAIIRHYELLQKIILIGDSKQLQPVVVSRDANEFFEERSRSLMVRLGDSGIPSVQLTQQYRMDPRISRFVSQTFYDGRLTDDPSTRNRSPAQRFETAVQNYFATINVTVQKSTLYFAHVHASQIWHRNNSTSLMNPQYLQSLVDVFVVLYKKLHGRHENGKPVTFAVMAYYAEEIGLLKRLIYRKLKYSEEDVAVINVDASRGKEYDYVFLSTCRIGGMSGLGFVANLNRMNVALSRARNGLIVFGDEFMGSMSAIPSETKKVYTKSAAHAAWEKLVQYCKDLRAVARLRNDGSIFTTELQLNLRRDWMQHGSQTDKDFLTP